MLVLGIVFAAMTVLMAFDVAFDFQEYRANTRLSA